mmetsp:Transcript_81103/g.262706  ORF Transcript_81103/g.262706 Transcript_81103/m.262706 type:complete len:255 (+) Transcript_81103:554-1318(+)
MSKCRWCFLGCSLDPLSRHMPRATTTNASDSDRALASLSSAPSLGLLPSCKRRHSIGSNGSDQHLRAQIRQRRECIQSECLGDNCQDGSHCQAATSQRTFAGAAVLASGVTIDEQNFASKNGRMPQEVQDGRQPRYEFTGHTCRRRPLQRQHIGNVQVARERRSTRGSEVDDMRPTPLRQPRRQHGAATEVCIAHLEHSQVSKHPGSVAAHISSCGDHQGSFWPVRLMTPSSATSARASTHAVLDAAGRVGGGT